MTTMITTRGSTVERVEVLMFDFNLKYLKDDRGLGFLGL